MNGTEFDLRTPTLLGSSIPRIEGEKPGFDHNFCLEKCGEKKLAARYVSPNCCESFLEAVCTHFWEVKVNGYF